MTAVLLLAGCAGPPVEQPAPRPAAKVTGPQTAALPSPGIPDTSVFARPSTRIVVPEKRQQCVPYARQVSGIDITGDAWTWWRSAQGRYATGQRPAVGSVLVLKRTARLRGGHVAVVTAILNSREILVDQANWLNQGQIHISTPVRDVSKNNDWSAVRVWYIPGDTYGVRTYAAHGFIYSDQVTATR
jgi:hypothetical protein